MKTILALLCFVAGSLALTNPPITGPTPSPIHCPNSLCEGKSDGNHEHGYEKNYFVQCVSGLAYCQACWPQNLVFSGKCNQCMYSKHDPCYTTQSWVPAVQYPCPNLCASKGYEFKGNMADPSEGKHYVGCWNGMTMGCVNCPAGLYFNEYENACLYEGKYYTQPDNQ